MCRGGEGVMVCSCVALRSGGAAVCLFYAQAQVGWSLLIYLAAKYKMITLAQLETHLIPIVMLPIYHSRAGRCARALSRC